MVGAVTGRAVAVSVQPLVPRQQPVQGSHEIVVRPSADLDDDQPGRRMGYEDGQEPILALRRVRGEGRTRGGQVEQSATATGPDGQLSCVYGKMLRMASRSRPSPPPAGADS